MNGDDETRRILEAAGDGALDQLRAMLEAAPGLANAIGQNPYWGGRFQPLHAAATWGQSEAVDLLLAAGADPAGRNEEYGGWSPLMIAAGRGHQGIVRRLLAAGARVGPFEAAALGRVEALRVQLAANPALAGEPTRDGTTLLHVAANGEVAALLVAAGADPDAVDDYGGRPLDAAIARAARDEPGAHEVAAALIAAGVATDAATHAALGDVPGLAQRVAADPEALGRPGRSGLPPLHAAVRAGRLDAIDWLLAHGADPEAPDGEGVSPLHHASGAPRNAVAIARRLLEAGADPAARDGVHEATPASWAEFQRRPELHALLEAAEGHV